MTDAEHGPANPLWSSENPSIRRRAMDADLVRARRAGGIDDAFMLPIVRELLHGATPVDTRPVAVRGHLWQDVGTTLREGSFPACATFVLANPVADDSPRLASEIDLLGALGDERAVPRLLELARNPARSGLRWDAIIALGRIGSDDAAAPLQQMYDEARASDAPDLNSLHQLSVALTRLGRSPEPWFRRPPDSN
jgi:HEAT repeat protein